MDTNNPTATLPKRQLSSGEPIKEGLAAHLKRIDALIGDIGQEIVALQRIEKALKDCHERLDRQGGLIVMETQLVSALIQRDSKPPVGTQPVKAVPLDKLAERVEDDLKRLVPDVPAPAATKDFASTDAWPAPLTPLTQPVGFVPKR